MAFVDNYTLYNNLTKLLPIKHYIKLGSSRNLNIGLIQTLAPFKNNKIGFLAYLNKIEMGNHQPGCLILYATQAIIITSSGSDRVSHHI